MSRPSTSASACVSRVNYRSAIPTAATSSSSTRRRRRENACGVEHSENELCCAHGRPRRRELHQADRGRAGRHAVGPRRARDRQRKGPGRDDWRVPAHPEPAISRTDQDSAGALFYDGRQSWATTAAWGPVPEEWIIGQAFGTYRPPKDRSLLAPTRPALGGRRAREAPPRRAAHGQPPVPLRPRARQPVLPRGRGGPRQSGRTARGGGRAARLCAPDHPGGAGAHPARRLQGLRRRAARRSTRSSCARPSGSRSRRGACAASTSAACTSRTWPRCATRCAGRRAGHALPRGRLPGGRHRPRAAGGGGRRRAQRGDRGGVRRREGDPRPLHAPHRRRLPSGTSAPTWLPTPDHRATIAKLGITDHRRSFQSIAYQQLAIEG